MIFKSEWKLIGALVLFSVLFFASWPLYKYIFDVDGVGYASVTNQYALGNFTNAVNGYWSPLHSWMVVPFHKLGIETIAAFKITNAIISVFILIVLNSLLKRFELSASVQTVVLYTGIILLLHFAWFELAADLLLVLWLLIYFQLTSSAIFFNSRYKNILVAVVAALAYLTKAYAFPFFIIHFLFLHLIVNRKQIRFDLLFTGIAVFLLCCFPWIYALYDKYGRWMIGTSGKLNASWYLVADRNPDLLFFPPPFNGSSSFWEDPWYVQKTFFTAFSSSALFLHQLRVTAYNIQQWLKCLSEISIFAPAVLPVMLVRYFQFKQKRDLLFTAFFVLLPAGYLLIHIETRFLWVLSFLFLAAGALWLEPFLAEKIKSRWQRNLIWVIFFVSFLLEPVNHLKDRVYHQKEIHQLAAVLKQNGFKGKFTSNKKAPECMILAYLTGSSYYTPNSRRKAEAMKTTAFKQEQLNYCFYFYDSENEKEILLQQKELKLAASVKEMIPGLLVAEL
jgi:hypothetical protein